EGLLRGEPSPSGVRRAGFRSVVDWARLADVHAWTRPFADGARAMFCPNCGKQNKDDLDACAFCGHELQKPKPRFKGTMMMTAPRPRPPAPAAVAPPPAAGAPDQRSVKKTMVGGFALPPGGIQPPAPAVAPPPAAPAAAVPPAAVVPPPAAPAAGSVPPPAA